MLKKVLRFLRSVFWSVWTPLYLVGLILFLIALAVSYIAFAETFAVIGKKGVEVAGLNGNIIKLSPCKPFHASRVVQCGVYEVFEDRQAKSGRKIPIHFVVDFATSDTPKEEPIFYIDGGPGVGKAVIAGFSIDDEHHDRDNVYIDVRGSGESNTLSCVGLKASPFKLGTYLKSDFSEYKKLFSVQHYLGGQYDQQDMLACRKTLEQHADLTKYTTTLAAADLNEIRVALGYEKINVTGASYGTRLSLEYIRRYPETVRAASLVDIVPTTLRMPSTFAAGTQRSLNLLLSHCDQDALCKSAYPNVRHDLNKVLSRLNSSSVSFRMKNPLLFEMASEDVQMAYGPFVMGIRGMLYGYESSAMLPYVITEAAEGNFVPMAGQIVEQTLPLELVLAKGMYLSVTCAEDVPFIDEEIARQNAEGTILGVYRLEQHLGACSVWSKGEVPDDWLDPIIADIPILLFSGELDPSTPPTTGEEVLSGFRNGKLIIMKNESHGADYNWERCGKAIEEKFWEQASVEGLDTSCADEIDRPPYYIPETDDKP